MLLLLLLLLQGLGVGELVLLCSGV